MTIEIQRGKVVEVDRGITKLRLGQGLIKGLGVIWHHWGKSWTKKLEKMSDTDGIFTVQYPEERLELPEAYRNMPILLYDDDTGHELCTSCFQCERICPPQVIHIKQAKHPETGKPIPVAEEFIIEYDACMSCGFCAEVCPFDSIKMDHVYELSTWDHPSLTVDKQGLIRSVSYYKSIAPTLWEEAQANAYKKLENTKKRRIGTLGIAQEFLDNPKQPAPAKKATPAAASPSAASQAAPSAPPAATGKSMSADKKAKLEAIRAANAAKQAATGEGVAAAPAPAASSEAVQSEASAPAAASGGGSLPFSTDNIMAGVPAETRMSDEMKAKLRSVRENNLKKRGLM